MEAHTLLISILDAHWQHYRAQLKHCRNECSEAAVHDLRVSTRRLLASLKLAHHLAQQTCLQKMHHAFKKQVNSFTDLRDTQMMLAEISKRLRRLPQLNLLMARLQKREKRQLRAAKKQINEFQTHSNARRLSKVRALLAALPDEALSSRILQAADQAFLKVIQRYELLDAAQAASIHPVRVAFKKFRYLVESIQPMLPDFPPDTLKRMQDYQTRMGEIQNTLVLLRTLADAARRDKTYDPEPARRFYARHLADVFSLYLKSKSELYTFWRIAPGAERPLTRPQEKHPSGQPPVHTSRRAPRRCRTGKNNV